MKDSYLYNLKFDSEKEGQYDQFGQFEVWSWGVGDFIEWFAPGQPVRNKVPGLLKQLGYFLLYSGAWAEVQMPGSLNVQFSATPLVTANAELISSQ